MICKSNAPEKSGKGRHCMGGFLIPYCLRNFISSLRRHKRLHKKWHISQNWPLSYHCLTTEITNCSNPSWLLFDYCDSLTTTSQCHDTYLSKWIKHFKKLTTVLQLLDNKLPTAQILHDYCLTTTSQCPDTYLSKWI